MTPPQDPVQTPGSSRRKLRRVGAVVASLLVHLAALGLILASRETVEMTPEQPPVYVELFRPPPPPVTPSEPAPEEAPAGGGGAEAATAVDTPVRSPPAPVVPAPSRPVRPLPVRVRPAPRTPEAPPAPAAPEPESAEAPAPPMPVVGAGQLAGALRAGAGGGGSGAGSGGGQGNGRGGGRGAGCDMVARLQAALRDDAGIRAEIARAHREAGAGAGAILLWNGDWQRDPTQEGKGLAGVRQAIAVEVAFAPRACQAEPVRGLVLLTLSDAPGGPRLALGTGRWTWADLLERRR